LKDTTLGVRSLVSIDRLNDFWNILREVDPQTVVREADVPIRIVLCGPVGVGKRALAAALTVGEIGPSVVEVTDVPADVPVAFPVAELFVYVVSSDQPVSLADRERVRLLARRSSRVVCVINDRWGLNADKLAGLRAEAVAAFGVAPNVVLTLSVQDPGQVSAAFGDALVAAVPHLALPLGRRLPVFREAAARCLIRETSRVNAEFAAVSSIPAIVPLVGGLAAAGADIIVLTKNQVMLLLKLATLYGRTTENRFQVLTEVGPVIGAAFLWRSLARALMDLLPSPLTVAPKVAVAFVGTYVVGMAGQHYYRWGQRPSPELIDRFRQEALGQIGVLTPLLARLGRGWFLP
jgi:hypothetical protein